MDYPPWAISYMVPTNGLGKVIVVGIRYPESIAWRLDANLTTHCKRVASEWKKTSRKSLISIKLLRAVVSGPHQYTVFVPLSLSLVLFITLQPITNKKKLLFIFNCCKFPFTCTERDILYKLFTHWRLLVFDSSCTTSGCPIYIPLAHSGQEAMWEYHVVTVKASFSNEVNWVVKALSFICL